MARIQLTQEQVDRINQTLKDLSDTSNDIVKLAACGVDCEQRMREVDQVVSQLTKLKEHFAHPS